MRTFDAVVVGSGPAGEVAAGRLGKAGLEAAIVEEELIGGECAFWACMPSKALLRAGELLPENGRVPGAAEAVTGSLDVTSVLRRRDDVIGHFDDSRHLPWLEKNDVEIFRGHATITGERRLKVGDEEIEARRAIVFAPGTRQAMPPVEGIEDVEPWTNREGTTSKRVPESLIVLGGGVVGVELSQAWASLGSKVTLVETLDRLIGREEPFASEHVQESLEARGVDVRLGAKATRAFREAGLTVLELEGGERVSAEQLLLGAGRTVRTEAVEDLGYEPGEPIEVDGRMRSRKHPWLYVIGDANGIAQLTHMGKYQASIATDCIAGRGTEHKLVANGPRSPRIIYTDPQVAAVGYTEENAKEDGIAVRCAEVEVSGNAAASFYGRGTPGTAKLVVDEERRVVIGATLTGFEVAELLHAFTIAVVQELTVDDLWHAVPSFPTRSEIWLRLLESYGPDER